MRCGALKDDGTRCKSNQTLLYSFSGESELRAGTEKIGWVAVYLCEKHGKDETRYSESKAIKEARAWHRARRKAGIE